MSKVKQQKVTDRFAVYNSDCMLVLPTLDDESIDLNQYNSPPFAGLYNYSSSENDFSNCESKEQFWNNTISCKRNGKSYKIWRD